MIKSPDSPLISTLVEEERSSLKRTLHQRGPNPK
jgi:hypothetical protein